jgi:dethiobiotin synthase
MNLMRTGFKRLAVTGTGTEVGKTTVATTLALGLGAWYWKPLQTGGDSDRGYARERGVRTFAEAYVFDLPAAPAHAGRVEPENIVIPQTESVLIIEGAGGALVPIRGKYLWADWLAENRLPTFLVVRRYLGCIHHTLATVESLQSRGIKILGLIFNDGKEEGGPSFRDETTRKKVMDESREYIVDYTALPDLGLIKRLERDDEKTLREVFDTVLGPRLQKLEGFDESLGG